MALGFCEQTLSGAASGDDTGQGYRFRSSNVSFRHHRRVLFADLKAKFAYLTSKFADLSPEFADLRCRFADVKKLPAASSGKLPALVIRFREKAPSLKALEIAEFLRNLRVFFRNLRMDFRRLRADFRDLTSHFRNLRSEFRDLSSGRPDCRSTRNSPPAPCFAPANGEDTRPFLRIQQSGFYLNIQLSKNRYQMPPEWPL